MNLPFFICAAWVGILIALTVYLVFRVREVRVFLRRDMYARRRSLPIEMLYEKVKSEKKIFGGRLEDFCIHWCRIATILSVDPLKLRPEDRISELLLSGKDIIADESADIAAYLLSVRGKYNSAHDSSRELTTLSDVIAYLFASSSDEIISRKEQRQQLPPKGA